jgi:hypothetical protein
MTSLNLTEIAAKYGVDHSAVVRFKQRNAEALDAAMRIATNNARVVAIANKEYRLGVKDRLETLLEAVRVARANGGTGESTGLVTKTYRMIGTGENAQIKEEYKVDVGLVAAIDSLHKSAAEELGQLPRPDQNINIKAMLLLREVGGTDVEVS